MLPRQFTDTGFRDVREARTAYMKAAPKVLRWSEPGWWKQAVVAMLLGVLGILVLLP